MTPKLTTVGKALLLRALDGEELHFTKVRFGNGAPQNSLTATALSSPVLALSFSSITAQNDYVKLSVSFTNSSVQTGFHITEVGFYVEDPGDENTEILYAIGNEVESSADFIPSASERILEMSYNAFIFVGDAQNISAAISSSLVYTTKSEFDTHVENTNNPHAVTKEQIGLGNVANLGVNDLEPTYTPPVSLTNLTSGEKLSLAFGKIHTAIASLINHIANRNNPHGVTAAQAGAAAASHTHTGADIVNSAISFDANGSTFTGTVNFSNATVSGLPAPVWG